MQKPTVERRYRKKPVIVSAINFDELVAHGIASGGNVVNGMPWSFTYKNHPLTHENDDCYLIPTLEGIMKMGRDDLLITGVKGEIYPCKREIFEATYDPVAADQSSTEDAATELRIREIGADVAPRVTKADIDALMGRVVFTYDQRPNGSTTTFCHAFLDGSFFLATGMSAAVSAENFNAELGRDMATNKAFSAARDKLWELEGYRLHRSLQGN
jgi:hypothetical protein